MKNSIAARKVLIVSPVECYPSISGNSARIGSIVNQIVDLGFDVYYAHFPERPFDPGLMIQTFGKKYYYRPYLKLSGQRITFGFKALRAFLLKKKTRLLKVDDFLSSADIPFFEKIISDIKPDIVFINYTYYSKLFDYLPASVLKILDTHDSMYLRFKNIFKFKRGYKNLEVQKHDEINCLNRADKVICIQDEEKQFFLQSGCRKELFTIGHTLKYQQLGINTERAKLGYIATDYHVNVAGITKFLLNIWPNLHREFPDIKLCIAGTVCNSIRHIVRDESICLMGVVDSLEAFYKEMDVCINPVLSGSGLKIKCVEPLSFGRPLITTSIGSQGLEEFINSGLYIMHDSYDESIRDIIFRLFSNDGFYLNSIASISRVIGNYNSSNIETLKDVLEVH